MADDGPDHPHFGNGSSEQLETVWCMNHIADFTLRHVGDDELGFRYHGINLV